ncbi:MAG TPA: YIP1 family protein, partial [Methanosarcinales archaeon]|nr:YIP1 family protein [Methanosarcinales archaeon]
EVSVIASIFAVIGAIGGLIMQFIGWLLYAGVFYAISMLFKGTGSFKRVFEFVGYGFIPMIIATVIGVAATLAVLPTIEFSPGTPHMHPLTLAATIIQILLLLWSANIWIFGIKHARNPSTKYAIITVLGIPAVFCLLWGIAMIYLYTSGI